MSDALIQRLRNSRKVTVKVGKFKFIARRPTDGEASELRKNGLDRNTLHVAREFVTGWEDVTEADVVPSGGPDAVPFYRQLWHEWCDDRPDFWEPIWNAVMDAYVLHAKNRKDAEKN